MYLVYVSSAGDRHIHVLTLDPQTGKVTPLETVTVPGPDEADPISLPLALSPDHRHLYAAIRTAPYPVATFAIDQGTGKLSLRGSVDLPAAMAYIVPDRTGCFLFGASYTNSKLAVNTIGEDGLIAAPNIQLFDEPRAHGILPSVDNRFAYAAIHGSDLVLQLAHDPATGRLTPNPQQGGRTKAGAGPRHLVLDASGERLYVLNESIGEIDSFTVGRDSGVLTPLSTVSMLPDGFSQIPTGADLHLARNGRLLFASERTASFLAGFRVDPKTGRLQLISSTPTEESPRGFCIDPSDRFLVCAGQISGKISVYAIDQETGALRQTDQRTVGRNPNWIEIIELPAA
jgi:6-phosphogluconolactonase